MNTFIFSCALLLACFVSAAEASTPLDDLRSLGADVAHAADRFEHGTKVSAADIAALNRRLGDAMASSAPDSTFHRKAAAIAIRLQELRSDMVQPKSPIAPLGRSQLDIETVSASHGATCANALGISMTHPVRVVLGTASDAWFFLSSSAAPSVRFATTSAGPDAVLEIFESCAPDAKAIASNDDAVGLDASVAIATTKAQTFFVHLSNVGESGPITLAAAAAAGTVSGTVKDAKTNAPLFNASVGLYSSTYGYEGNSYTDQNGAYTITAYEPGTYYVIANENNYLTQLYPAGFCPYGIYYYSSDCDTSHATTVTVTSVGAVQNINFAMSTGVTISGQVRASNNTPLFNSMVLLLKANGQAIRQVYTDMAGHYTFPTVAPASYVLQAQAGGYGSQLFDHVPCSGPQQLSCNALAATPINVSAQDVHDINFSLPVLSGVTGHVTDSGGHPLYAISVTVTDQNGTYISASGTDINGNYSTGGVGTGTYYVFASGDSVFSQIYPGYDCFSYCATEIPGNGTPLTFTAAGQTVKADFVLHHLPTLTGHITDAASGLPLPNVTVSVNAQPPSSNSYPYYTGSTDMSGNYSVPRIPGGQFFVWAESGDHVDQIYSGITCEAADPFGGANCTIAGATLLKVTPGEESLAPFDFALSASSGISGHVGLRAGAGSDLAAAASVSVVDGTGRTVGYASADLNGNYAVTDLAPGTYFAIAVPNYSPATISQIWQGIDCTTCVATSGTPIVLPSATSATGIDFQMTRLDAVVGRVTDNRGAPISGAVIDLFATSDRSYVSGSFTDSNGYYAAGAAVGYSYYVATEAGGGYTDQVYSGIACPHGNAYDHQCALTSGTPVNLSSGATQPHIVNFALTPNDRVFSNGFE